jgi:8-oxo-dGTP pyrophosphatase MutT (NUDIX family)
MMRRIIHFYWRFARPMTLGVRGVVLDFNNQVFLVRHGYAPGWHFPGGGVEAGETSLDAVSRELLEEGNIRVKGTPQLHGLFFNGRYSRRDHVAVYVVRDFERPSAGSATWEIAESGFFPTDKLPQGTTDATRRRLEEILYGTPTSSRW